MSAQLKAAKSHNVLVGLLLVSLSAGCATKPASYAPPVAEDVRVSARLVEVVASAAAPPDLQPRLDAPVGQGKQAAKEGGAAASAGLFTGVIFAVTAGPMALAVAVENPLVPPLVVVSAVLPALPLVWSHARKVSPLLTVPLSESSPAVPL